MPPIPALPNTDVTISHSRAFFVRAPPVFGDDPIDPPDRTHNRRTTGSKEDDYVFTGDPIDPPDKTHNSKFHTVVVTLDPLEAPTKPVTPNELEAPASGQGGAGHRAFLNNYIVANHALDKPKELAEHDVARPGGGRGGSSSAGAAAAGGKGGSVGGAAAGAGAGGRGGSSGGRTSSGGSGGVGSVSGSWGPAAAGGRGSAGKNGGGTRALGRGGVLCIVGSVACGVLASG